MIEKDGKSCGVILSGGKSRRMAGKDKAFLKIGNKFLLERVIENLDKQVDILAINTNAFDLSYHKYGHPVLKDIVSGYLGPLAGLLTSMSWAEEKGYENVVTVAVDTPFFPANFVDRMKKEMIKSQAKIVLARSFSIESKTSIIHPIFGLWCTSLNKDLSKSLEDGTRKVLDWVFRHPVEYVTFQYEGIDPFFNINQNEDLNVLDEKRNIY